MTTAEVLKRFPQLTRDQLYFWERKHWIHSTKIERGKSQTMTGRDYSASEVKKISVMAKSYAEGYTPERAYHRACQIALLESNEITRLHDVRHALATALQ